MFLDKYPAKYIPYVNSTYYLYFDHVYYFHSLINFFHPICNQKNASDVLLLLPMLVRCVQKREDVVKEHTHTIHLDVQGLSLWCRRLGVPDDVVEYHPNPNP